MCIDRQGVVMVSLDRAFVLSVSSVLSSASVVAVADQAIPATSAELTEVVILGSRPRPQNYYLG